MTGRGRFGAYIWGRGEPVGPTVLTISCQTSSQSRNKTRVGVVTHPVTTSTSTSQTNTNSLLVRVIETLSESASSLAASGQRLLFGVCTTVGYSLLPLHLSRLLTPSTQSAAKSSFDAQVLRVVVVDSIPVGLSMLTVTGTPYRGVAAQSQSGGALRYSLQRLGLSRVLSRSDSKADAIVARVLAASVILESTSRVGSAPIRLTSIAMAVTESSSLFAEILRLTSTSSQSRSTSLLRVSSQRLTLPSLHSISDSRLVGNIVPVRSAAVRTQTQSELQTVPSLVLVVGILGEGASVLTLHAQRVTTGHLRALSGSELVLRIVTSLAALILEGQSRTRHEGDRVGVVEEGGYLAAWTRGGDDGITTDPVTTITYTRDTDEL